MNAFIKMLLVSFLLFSPAVLADESEVRTWTQLGTGKEIIGRLSSKLLDGSKALIVRQDNGKSVWLEAKDLIEADREYIRLWIASQNQVTARIVAFGNPGWKKVKTKIVAGNKPLVVHVTGAVPPPVHQIAGLPVPPFTRTVEKGKTLEFEFGSGSVYSVNAQADGVTVDCETDKIKTGL
ncbi:MAG: hypothetical protein KF712_01570 [Akkermansiaceae bacterium]|nr:hypothetical protein [Akkermansiaceae bacterium]